MNYNYQALNNEAHICIPTGDLYVSPYEIEQLHEVEIRQKMNEHFTLKLKGVLKNTQGDEYAELSTEGTNVALFAYDTNGEAYVLYQGIVKEVMIKNTEDTRYIEVEAISYSYMMDIEKKSRSFQDKSKTYTELFDQVAGSYPGAVVTDMATNGAVTSKFIMQHEETDWAFLKRLASHFNTGLICDARFDKPSCYLGIPSSPVQELATGEYTAGKDIDRYKQLSENGVMGISEQDFIRYETETNYVLMTGDAVKFKEKELCVSEIVSTTNRDVFVSKPVLMPKKGLSQPFIPNSGVVGAAYSGQITEVKNDRVKVALSTDAGHDPGTPCWFPYSTIYSSKSGSGWYCMPEIGDSIRIYFPDGDDDHAYAISSVHEAVDDDPAEASGGAGAGGGGGGSGGYSGKRDNPEVKSLKYGSKEVRLTPEGVYILTENAMITLTEEGVAVTTDDDIEFNSEKSIIMNAEEDISVIGETGIELLCETASIEINENVEAVGQEVWAN